MNSSMQNSRKNNVLLGIKHCHKSDRDIVTWENKDLPKDIISIVIFLLVAFAVPILLTGLLHRFLFEVFTLGVLKVFREFSFQSFVLVIFIFVWLIAIFLALVIFRCLLWTEIVVISDSYVVLFRKGFWARKEMRFRREDVVGLGYGKYDPWHEGELRYSLNIIYRQKFLGMFSSIETEGLAAFSRKKEKYQLFLYLQIVLQEWGWPTVDGTK